MRSGAFAKHGIKKRRKRLVVWMITVGILVGIGSIQPRGYRAYVNHRFAADLDDTFGQGRWCIVERGADFQHGEQINLYRTLYVRFIYPHFQRHTPWRDLEFTHKNSCDYRPWHYWIAVEAEQGDITYYWSMRQNRWVKKWDNRPEFWPREEQIRSYFQRIKEEDRVILPGNLVFQIRATSWASLLGKMQREDRLDSKAKEKIAEEFAFPGSNYYRIYMTNVDNIQYLCLFSGRYSRFGGSGIGRIFVFQDGEWLAKKTTIRLGGSKCTYATEIIPSVIDSSTTATNKVPEETTRSATHDRPENTFFTERQVFLTKKMAEGEGFEPPEACASTVFKTAAIGHSATPPRKNL